MGIIATPRAPDRAESWLALGVFIVCLGFHFAGALVGWQSKNLPGVEYRQAQTALSAEFIKLEDNFSLAYPTPVLGKPWSIPLEFPLYQWTTVVLSKVTGLSLTKAGRLVSMACFYLMLPAVFLLLAEWGIARGRRWLVLAVIVTCPLYIFYSRAFLIETMALMFSIWFWVAFVRAVSQRSLGWLAVAIAAGSGAGLVKVTTFLLYLVPVAWWALLRLRRERGTNRWRGDIGWMAAAVAIPFAMTYWWLRFSDAIKSQNLVADFLRSDRAISFTLGSPATRVSGELWAMKGRIIADQLTWLPLLAGCAVLALLGARHRWREILFCLVIFTTALVAFPILYAYHEYYYIANAVLLMLAMGLVLVALAESKRPRWLVALAALTVVAGQVYGYLNIYYPVQRGISQGGDGLSQSLRALTEPNEVIVVTGQDWNSMTPYYAQRRALMLRRDIERDSVAVDQALAALNDEKIGALVLDGPLEGREWLIQRFVARGLDPVPLYHWRGMSVFVPASRRSADARKLDELGSPEVRYGPGAAPRYEQPVNGWYIVSLLPAEQRRMFDGMQPRPTRVFSSFGLTLERGAGRMDFGVHPETRLEFTLPAGHHVLRTTVVFSPEAYRSELADADATDGVEITLAAVGPGEERQVLDTRIVDPRHRPQDRGRRPLRIEFTLPRAENVELFIGPGPSGRDNHDWVSLGRLIID